MANQVFRVAPRGVLVSAILTVASVGVAFGSDVVRLQTMTRDQAYAASRLDALFNLVAAIPAVRGETVPMAMKGDLLVPPGCRDGSTDTEAECMDVAYELPAEPSIVVETVEGTTTTLMRMDAVTIVAGGGHIDAGK